MQIFFLIPYSSLNNYYVIYEFKFVDFDKFCKQKYTDEKAIKIVGEKIVNNGH